MIALAPEIAFQLPSALEAHEPPEARGLGRDGVRMLVSRTNGDLDAGFREIADFLNPGDVLVINTSATIPAALRANKADGSALELHISTALQGGLYVVEPRLVRDVSAETLTLAGGGRAHLLAPYAGSARLWIAKLELPEPLIAYLDRFGEPISYPYIRGSWPLPYYQTAFAIHPGSSEMPSAGRPFSAAVLERLVRKGVIVARLTLHCGVASLEHDEPPYEERFTVPAETAETVNAARRQGRQVIAVGTTVARALESAIDEKGRLVAARGWTEHVISPTHPVRTFSGLLTGFHEPRSTHLALVQALVPLRHLERAYSRALAGAYLWHEFGDVHLILTQPGRGV